MATFFTPQTDPALFACACGACPPDFQVTSALALLDCLDRLRARVGHPLRVTSGVRCPAKNARVGGVVGSEHTTGEAADLATPDAHRRYALIHAALGLGISRLGIGPTWVHVGIAERFPSRTPWWEDDHPLAH